MVEASSSAGRSLGCLKLSQLYSNECQCQGLSCNDTPIHQLPSGSDLLDVLQPFSSMLGLGAQKSLEQPQ